jgi:hypothetical protein
MKIRIEISAEMKSIFTTFFVKIGKPLEILEKKV